MIDQDSDGEEIFAKKKRIDYDDQGTIESGTLTTTGDVEEEQAEKIKAAVRNSGKDHKSENEPIANDLNPKKRKTTRRKGKDEPKKTGT